MWRYWIFFLLTLYNGIFNVKNKNIKFIFISVSDRAEYNIIQIPPGAYERESMNAEFTRINIEEGYITEEVYPFSIKPIFSTLGSFIEIRPGRGWQISFVQGDTLRDLLGSKPKIIYEEYNLSDYPVDILSFDNLFLEGEITQGMIFKGKRTGIKVNFTMDLDAGYKHIEKGRAHLQWYLYASKEFNSSINFQLKNENIDLVFSNGQSITFYLWIKEI